MVIRSDRFREVPDLAAEHNVNSVKDTKESMNHRSVAVRLALACFASLAVAWTQLAPAQISSNAYSDPAVGTLTVQDVVILRSAIDHEYLEWQKAWLVDRYVSGSAYFRKTSEQPEVVEGTLEISAQNSVRTISFFARFRRFGPLYLAIVRTCYDDPANLAKDCTANEELEEERDAAHHRILYIPEAAKKAAPLPHIDDLSKLLAQYAREPSREDYGDNAKILKMADPTLTQAGYLAVAAGSNQLPAILAYAEQVAKERQMVTTELDRLAAGVGNLKTLAGRHSAEARIIATLQEDRIGVLGMASKAARADAIAIRDLQSLTSQYLQGDLIRSYFDTSVAIEGMRATLRSRLNKNLYIPASRAWDEVALYGALSAGSLAEAQSNVADTDKQKALYANEMDQAQQRAFNDYWKDPPPPEKCDKYVNGVRSTGILHHAGPGLFSSAWCE